MWKHDTLRSCKFAIGQGYIELDDRGVVLNPTLYAQQVLKRYGSVTGFSPFVEVQESITEDTASTVVDAPAEAKPKRKRASRKTATKDK